MKFKHLYLGLCLALGAGIYNGHAQAFDKTKELNRMVSVPNSPEAQAFTKYGNVELGYYTGTPNIEVPLYTHQGRELDLPITLTYDGSGVKVEQEATNVGLSWNLNLGGRISRIKNGLEDDYISSHVGTPHKSLWNDDLHSKIELYTENNSEFTSREDVEAYLRFLKQVNDNEFDTEPDFYSFNALGINDMFVIDVKDRVPFALNNPRIKVSLTKTNATTNRPGSVNTWEVISDDGTKFYFEETEVTDRQSDYDNSVAALNSMQIKYNSSWLLTKIVSPNEKDEYLLNTNL